MNKNKNTKGQGKSQASPYPASSLSPAEVSSLLQSTKAPSVLEAPRCRPHFRGAGSLVHLSLGTGLQPEGQPTCRALVWMIPAPTQFSGLGSPLSGRAEPNPRNLALITSASMGWLTLKIFCAFWGGSAASSAGRSPGPPSLLAGRTY